MPGSNGRHRLGQAFIQSIRLAPGQAQDRQRRLPSFWWSQPTRNEKMKILVINCGSSSIKYKLFQLEGRQVVAEGIVERIGEPCSRVTHLAFPGTPKSSTLQKEAPGPRPRPRFGDGRCAAQRPGLPGDHRSPRNRRRRSPGRAWRRILPHPHAYRQRHLGQNRSGQPTGAAAQPGQPQRHHDGPPTLSGHAASGGFRHGLSSEHAPPGLPLRPARRDLHPSRPAPLRVPRHLAPVRCPRSGAPAGPIAGKNRSGHLAPGQRLFGLRRP